MHYKNAKKFEARKALINWVKEYPLALIADVGLRKLVLRAETHFTIIDLFRKKAKNWIFCDSCWAKSGFLVSTYVLK